MDQPLLFLPERPTLNDFQRYASEMVQQRGFGKETSSELLMFLLEECGELAKAARKFEKMRTDPKSESFELPAEAADVFIVLLCLCNYHGIDLEKAFRAKEEMNKKRVWK